MQDLFRENKGTQVEVVDPKVRFIASDVAIEEGTARVIVPGEPPSESSYLAVHVKKDGKWSWKRDSTT